MEITIGKGDFVVTTRFLHPKFHEERLKGGKLLGLQPRHVYRHDCTLGDLNPARPGYFVVGPTLSIFDMGPVGLAPGFTMDAMVKSLLANTKTTGSKSLTAALFKTFPLSQVEVPWKKLLRGVDEDRSKFIVVAWVRHDYIAFTMSSPFSPIWLLGFPKSVEFALIEIGQCGEVENEEEARAKWKINFAEQKLKSRSKLVNKVVKAAQTDDAEMAILRGIEVDELEKKVAKDDKERRDAYVKELQGKFR